MSQLEPEGRPKEPKGSEREPNPSQKGAKGEPNGSQNGAVAKCSGAPRLRSREGNQNGSPNGAIFHQKADRKIGAEIDVEKVIILTKRRRKISVQF